MKQRIAVALVAVLTSLSFADAADAARVRVRRGRHVTRVHVSVRPGFPIRRTLPTVVVRPAPVVRVAPRTYLAPIAFGAVVVASLPPARARVWAGSEVLEDEDGWTDFTMNFDRRGTALLMEVERGTAQVSFAEVVFDNGDAQIVDFDDRVQARGIYSLIDFRDGRKVDHVRIVAQSAGRATEIKVHLVS